MTRRDAVGGGLIVAAVVLAHLPYLLGVFVADPLGQGSFLVSASTPGPLPGLPVLDPNVGVISQALGHRAALDLVGLHVPWWNPYSGTGTPLAGEMQSAALFPPTLFTLAAGGQLYEHMLLEIAAGLATYWLCRRLGLSRAAGTVAGMLFALNGTFAWFGHATVNPVAFLPLLLVGVELAADAARSGRRGGWWLIALALAGSIYAGFPEVAYINGLLALTWLLWRLAALPGDRRAAMLAKATCGAAAAALIAAPLIIATLDFFGQATIPLHSSGYYGSVHIPAAGLPQLVLPYIYGPLFAFASTSWGFTGGYLSVALIPLGLVGVLSRRHRGLSRALLVWLVLALARAYGVPGLGDVLGLLPGMSRVAFSRYAFPALELPWIMLAAIGFDAVAHGRVPRRRWLAITGVSLGVVVAAAVGARPLASELGAGFANSAYYPIAVGWGLLVVLAVGLFGLPRAPGAAASRRTIRGGAHAWIAAILVLDAVVLFALPDLSAPRAQRIDTQPVTYLRRHLGDARFASLGPLQPNYGAYFGVASLNSSDGALPAVYARYVHSALNPFVAPTLLVGRKGAAALLYAPTTNAELQARLSGYRQAAVGYFLVSPTRPLDGPAFRLVAQSPTTLIYRLSGAMPYFTAGCSLEAHDRTTVQAQCRDPSTLVRRETDLAGWAATVNGHATPISAAGPFQSVSLPAGASRVSFSYQPRHILVGWLALVAGWLWLLVCASRLKSWRTPWPGR